LLAQRRLHAALFVALFAACLAASAAPTTTADAAAVGVNVAPTSGDYFASRAVARAIGRLHPGWVRVFMGWNALEPAPGVYSSSYLRNYALFFSHLPRGTRIDIDVEGTPAWASGSREVALPPREDASFGAFMAHVARRFGRRVSAYEIGDEEDDPAHWAGSVAEYVSLLRSAYGAIKGADRHATVILGGLSGNDYRYLEAVYRAGGGRYFDAVGVHTDDACDVTAPTIYARDRGTRMVNRWYFLGVSSVHAVMAAHHAAGKPIYMTEIGWSSTAAECAVGHWAGQKLAGVSAGRQAAFLTAAYRCLARRRFRYVRAALWFSLYDDGTSSAAQDNYGLLSASLHPKPAFAAMLAAARRGGRLRGTCREAIQRSG
jgi:hypothetical protein